MLPQLLLSGLSQGALYALMALAMSVVFRATSVVNFGHGDLLMSGAFTAYVLVVLVGLPFVAAGPLALTIMGVLGIAIQRWLVRPVQRGPHLSIAMMAIAVGYLLRGIASFVWGREILPFPHVYPDRAFVVGPVVITTSDMVVSGSVVVLLLALGLVFVGTPLGRTAQAVFQSERGAALVGINVPAFHGGMWGIGAVLAGAGGILIAPITLLYPDMAATSLVRGFAAMTLGGFGSFPGAVVGGLLLGIMELLAGGYVSSDVVDITAYVVIIAVLLVRPAGIFGRRVTVRV